MGIDERRARTLEAALLGRGAPVSAAHACLLPPSLLPSLVHPFQLHRAECCLDFPPSHRRIVEPPAPAPAPVAAPDETANADLGIACEDLEGGRPAQKPCCTEKVANGTDDIWCLQNFPSVSCSAHLQRVRSRGTSARGGQACHGSLTGHKPCRGGIRLLLALCNIKLAPTSLSAVA